MPVELFAGIPVTDYEAAVRWYERLFGGPPYMVPTEGEAVWEMAEHQYVFIERKPEHAGHTRHLLFVEDLDATVARIAGRGLTPAERETYENGVRKAAYLDPDGNRFEFGGAPASSGGEAGP